MAYRADHTQRILLIEHDEAVRHARTRKLQSLGYRVSALTDGEAAPLTLPPHLYDVIVVNAKGSSAVALNFSKKKHPRGPWPLVVVLASTPFGIETPSLPSVVISEPTVTATDEKLLAVLRSVATAKPTRGT